MAGNGCKGLKGQKWLGTISNCSNGWKQMKMAGNGWIGWKYINGSEQLYMAGMAVNDWIQLKWLAWMKMAGWNVNHCKL